MEDQIKTNVLLTCFDRKQSMFVDVHRRKTQRNKKSIASMEIQIKQLLFVMYIYGIQIKPMLADVYQW